MLPPFPSTKVLSRQLSAHNMKKRKTVIAAMEGKLLYNLDSCYKEQSDTIIHLNCCQQMAQIVWQGANGC